MSRAFSRLLCMAAMMAGQSPLMYGGMGSSENKPKRKPIEPMTPEREQKIMADIERNLHDFTIHGVVIRAKDKKTAIKIYNNRKGK